MAATEVMREVESIAFERDRQEFAMGDTLDIKTGILLAILTFLAILTGDLLKASGISHVEVLATLTGNAPVSVAFFQWIAQFISVVALIVGGFNSIRVLWPRYYNRDSSTMGYRDWIAKVDKQHAEFPETEPVTVEELARYRLDSAIEGIKENADINKFKSDLMGWTFACIAVSFSANVASLLSLCVFC